MREVIGDKDLNVSALAKDIGVSHTNIWFYLRGLRKWSLESWLDVLAALGRLEIRQDSIILKVKLEQEHRQYLKSLSSRHEKYVKK